MRKFNVLIIGAGKMGAFYDKPNSSYVLTHAHAFCKHKEFNLLGFYDTNLNQARKAARKWKTKFFSSLNEAFKSEKIDVVSVVVPDEDHYHILKKISQYSFKLVFTEKPLAKKNSEAKEIIKIYKKNNIPVMVNYSRRFVPEFQKIKKNVADGLYGKFIAGSGYYGKGLLHNGSHLIDLLRWYLGGVRNYKVINAIYDFSKGDPSLSAVLTFNNKKHFFLQGIDCRLYSIFEIDLIFEKGRVVIKESGLKIEEYEIKKNLISKGYKSLAKTKEIYTSSANSIYYAVENIYNSLMRNDNLKCDLQEGYKTMKTCMEIQREVGDE